VQSQVAVIQQVWASGVLDETLVRHLYEGLLHGLYLMDLALGTIGYAFTLKLFDTHVKSADATLFGWMVALFCYPPFNNVSGSFLAHGSNTQWITILGGGQAPLWLYAVCAAAILLLTTLYTWATVVFGLRFSNLTNRGILCRGPYAWVRHPAYVSKNLTWWLMSWPFLTHWLNVVGLLGWNLIYVLRASTEERHLRQDPHYREYCQRVPWKFIPGLW
jgi:protein-S-isoprenylcysteine O-methyltransferase Ste14